MSEKRFFTKINNKGRLVIIDKECHIELIDLTLACEVLNRLDLKLKTYNEQLGEQQATIEALLLDRDRQEEKLDIARRNLSKQLEKIEELQKKNAELTERLRECRMRLDKFNCR